MSDQILTPDQIIAKVQAAVAELENAAEVIATAEAKRDSTDLALKRRRAELRLEPFNGAAARRDAHILIETLDLEHAASVAQIAYGYAKNRANAAERALSGAQTIARLVETTYSGTVRR